jgi:hypothetical protein
MDRSIPVPSRNRDDRPRPEPTGSPEPAPNPSEDTAPRKGSAPGPAAQAGENARKPEPRSSADEPIAAAKSPQPPERVDVPPPVEPVKEFSSDKGAEDDSLTAESEVLHFAADRQSADPDEEAPLPAALRQPERRGSGPLAVIFWSLASLLMLALLGAQYAYYERYELAGNPTYRPWLEQMCKHLDCALPPRRDATAFELRERDVRYHPDYEGALLISGTFINGADFDQPYPTVEVMLKDVNGRIVASRRFAPTEYLHNSKAPSGLLKSGTEARLLLEVSDPGNQAVSFEFNFM